MSETNKSDSQTELHLDDSLPPESSGPEVVEPGPVLGELTSPADLHGLLHAEEAVARGWERIAVGVVYKPGDAVRADVAAKRRHRAKKESQGLKQLNVLVPEDDQTRDTLKAVAAALVEKRIAPGDLAALALLGPQERQQERQQEVRERVVEKLVEVERPLPAHDQAALKLGRKLQGLRGWRAFLARHLLG